MLCLMNEFKILIKRLYEECLNEPDISKDNISQAFKRVSPILNELEENVCDEIINIVLKRQIIFIKDALNSDCIYLKLDVTGRTYKELEKRLTLTVSNYGNENKSALNLGEKGLELLEKYKEVLKLSDLRAKEIILNNSKATTYIRCEYVLRKNTSDESLKILLSYLQKY